MAKLSLVGGDGPLRKPVQPPAALPHAAAAFSALPQEVGQPAAQHQQQQQPPQGFLLQEVQRLEKSFQMSLAEASEDAAGAVAVASPPAASDADSALEDIFSLLDDMEGLASELDSAVASTSELGMLTVSSKGVQRGRVSLAWRRLGWPGLT